MRINDEKLQPRSFKKVRMRRLVFKECMWRVEERDQEGLVTL